MPLQSLRTPLFLAAAILLGIVLLIELGVAAAAPFIDRSAGAVGWGIPSLALIDSLLVFTVLLMAAPLLFPERVTGRLQGILTLIFSLLLLIAAFLVGLAGLILLMLLIGLLMALPFGPVAYAALGYGTFPTGTAASTLTLLMTCKLVSAALLVLAHQRFLQNKGLLLLIGTSLLATFVVLFLHGLVPEFLVSVTDLIGAIIVVILTLIWAIITLIFAIIAVIKAIA